MALTQGLERRLGGLELLSCPHNAGLRHFDRSPGICVPPLRHSVAGRLLRRSLGDLEVVAHAEGAAGCDLGGDVGLDRADHLVAMVGRTFAGGEDVIDRAPQRRHRVPPVRGRFRQRATVSARDRGLLRRRHLAQSGPQCLDLLGVVPADLIGDPPRDGGLAELLDFRGFRRLAVSLQLLRPRVPRSHELLGRDVSEIFRLVRHRLRASHGPPDRVDRRRSW